MKKLLIIALVLSFTNIYAWHDPSGPGAGSAAMAGSGVADKTFWGVYQNQAALGFQDKFGLGFYYENRFMLSQTQYNHISAVIPALGGAFGVNMSYFGYNQFNEKKFGLAYGRKLGDKFALGVQMDYLHNFIADNYGSTGLLTFEIGLIMDISDNFSIGAHVFNPIQATLLDFNNERIEAILNVGTRWSISEKLALNFESEAKSFEDIRLKTGIEYFINDYFVIRSGVANNPNIFSFGVGIKYQSFIFDFASSMHQVLGFSPQFSLIYQIDKK
jgi:hypothetical protein